MDQRKIAEENLIFLTTTGSHAYGTNGPTSDIDYRGIFFAPKKNVIGPFFSVEQVEGFQGEKDSSVYELSKFIVLLVDQNPNILELLWVNREFIKFSTPIYTFLRSRKYDLLSSKVKHTFSGYAMSQLKRVKGHNKWINNEQPLRRPKEIDFVSVVWNQTKIERYNKEVPFESGQAWHLGNDIYGIFLLDDADIIWHDKHEALVSRPVTELVKSGSDGFDFDLIVKFNKQLYKEAVDNWQHYWDWKKNRNEARSELEEKYGYDTKHAMHLIRLLRMGLEILKSGEVLVYRPDASELLSIRNGTWSYDKLIEYSNELMLELDEVYNKTELRRTVDVTMANDLVCECYEYCWNKKV